MSSIGDFSIKAMDGWEDKLEESIETALEAVGLQAEGYAALELENSPRRVDTGLLRNSITHAVSGKQTGKKGYHADKSVVVNGAESVRVGFYSGNAPSDDSDHMSVYIGTNVEYAPYVHDGTMKMDANPFLKNAMEKHRDEYKRMFEYYLQS